MSLLFSLQQLRVPPRCVPEQCLPHRCQIYRLTDAFLQPLMTLIFGNLIQDFINFTNAIQNINPDDPQTTAVVEETARSFRHVAAKDASYLTYIGARVLV